MANIKLKSIEELETWNAKELRKLKMTINNRIGALVSSNKEKDLPKTHPLFGLEAGECKELLTKVEKAQKELARS